MSTKASRKLGVMVVGAGLHTRKHYLPYLAASPLAELRCIVEMEGPPADAAACYVRDRGPCTLIEVADTPSGELDGTIAAALDAAVASLGIGAVIIATTAEAHEPYLRWAVNAGLHTLVDKPVLAYHDASNDPDIARKVRTAFDEIDALAARRPDTTVAVAVQRRHHPAYNLLVDLAEEAAAATGAPITFLNSTHADGQFRTHEEIATIDYHGYRNGSGKQFHSGMHIYDLQAWLVASVGRAASMEYDSLLAHAASVRPAGFLRQFPSHKLDDLFGTSLPVPIEAASRFAGFGELDVAATTQFVTDGVPTLLCQTALLHNSFSRRSWPTARADLYKKNGRVKHEHHVIEQGPLQAIHFHSYQAGDVHDRHDARDYGVGGNSHMEVQVFRNAGLWPHPVEPLTVISGEEIAALATLSNDEMAIVQAKTAMLDEFVACATGAQDPGSHRASLHTLRLSNTLLSATTESLARNGVQVEVDLHAPQMRTEEAA